jgi:pSer/pThr/pTyr-binding forkhead associated (FHA) protein
VTVGTYELRGKVEAAAPAPAPERSAPAPAARVGGSEESAKTSVLQRPASGGAALIVGDHNGRRIGISDSATIGRLPECDVTLDDPSVSRRHARIQRKGSGWAVEDLGSTNGLKVNGTKVSESDLVDGDRLVLGSVQLLFSVGS